MPTKILSIGSCQAPECSLSVDERWGIYCTKHWEMLPSTIQMQIMRSADHSKLWQSDAERYFRQVRAAKST